MQVYMNKFSKNRVTLEEMKKSPKKPGWLQKKMAEAQEIAAERGKSVPKKYDSEPAKGTQPKKKKSHKKSSPTQGKKKR